MYDSIGDSGESWQGRVTRPSGWPALEFRALDSSKCSGGAVGSASERWWPKLVGRAQFWFRTTSQGLSYWTVGLISPTAKFLQTMSNEETETGF